jgi:hypothetical protein
MNFVPYIWISKYTQHKKHIMMTIHDCIHNVLNKIEMWVWEIWIL